MPSLRTTVLAGCAALLASAVACTPHAPASDLVGESAHFRLFVDRALTAFPPGFDGSNGLVALETEWSDVETMLKMPDGKIDYYWLTPEDIPAACRCPSPQEPDRAGPDEGPGGDRAVKLIVRLIIVRPGSLLRCRGLVRGCGRR